MKKSLLLPGLLVALSCSACQPHSALTPETGSGAMTSAQSKADQVTIDAESKAIIDALVKKDMATVATYASPNGVAFSPYSSIQSSVSFSPAALVNFFQDAKIYHWGVEDGSGLPMDMTPAQYYAKFIWDKPYDTLATITDDRITKHGNTINNIKSSYPNSKTVEYFVPPSTDGGLDWGQLWLIFQQESEGSWKLVAIVHDQWTI